MPEHQSLPVTKIVAGLVAVCASLLLAGALFGTDSTDSGPGPTSTIDGATTGGGPSGETGNLSTIVLLMDGWSMQAAGTSSLVADVGGKGQRVAFQAATEADIQALLDTHPEVVATAVARVFTADPDLTCDASGCTGSNKSWAAADLAALSSSPISESLSAQGVESSFVVGALSFEGRPSDIRITMAGADLSLIAAAGTSPINRNVGAELDASMLDEQPPSGVSDIGNGVEQTPVEAGEGPIVVESPDSEAIAEVAEENTVDVNQEPYKPVAIGYAFGRLFQMQPAWLSEPFELSAGFGVQRANIISILDSAAEANRAPLASGLANVNPSAGKLTASQLTALSSPTLGCGVGVICAMDTDHVTITEESVTSAILCDDLTGQIRQGDDSPKVRMVIRYELWDVSVSEGSAVQFGSWQAGVLAANEADTPFGATAIPQITTDATLRVSSVEIYDGLGELVSVSGEVTPVDEQATWLTIDNVIERTGSRFSRC